MYGCFVRARCFANGWSRDCQSASPARRAKRISSACASIRCGWRSPRWSLGLALCLGRIGSGFPNQRDFEFNLLAGREASRRWAKPYSQDLRDRVIEAVKRAEMSRRAAACRYEISESVAIKWLERVERDGSREPVGHGGHRASKLMPHRDFLEAAPGREIRTSRFEALCTIAFRPSEGSKPTPR